MGQREKRGGGFRDWYRVLSRRIAFWMALISVFMVVGAPSKETK